MVVGITPAISSMLLIVMGMEVVVVVVDSLSMSMASESSEMMGLRLRGLEVGGRPSWTAPTRRAADWRNVMAFRRSVWY